MPNRRKSVSDLMGVVLLLVTTPAVTLAHGPDKWTIDGNDIHSALSGNVCIGAVTPESRLHVRSTSATAIWSASGSTPRRLVSASPLRSSATPRPLVGVPRCHAARKKHPSSRGPAA